MNNNRAGVISLFVAACFYGMYGVFSRMIGSSFGDFSQNWVRNVIVVLLISIVIVINKTRLKAIQKADVKWLIIWFLCGGWVTVLTFIAFNNLPIGTVYLVVYCMMIAAGFLSGRFFFNEKMDLPKTISLMLALAGLAVIYQFTISYYQLLYLILAGVAGFLTGIWNTVSKKFSMNYHNNQMVFMDAISSVLAALAGALIVGEHLPIGEMGSSWMWIGIYAIIQTINVGLMVYGFKNVEAQIGSLILPVEIIFATIFSYLIFGEIPTGYSVLGGTLIITAAILPSLQAFRPNKKEQM